MSNFIFIKNFPKILHSDLDKIWQYCVNIIKPINIKIPSPKNWKSCKPSPNRRGLGEVLRITLVILSETPVISNACEKSTLYHTYRFLLSVEMTKHTRFFGRFSPSEWQVKHIPNPPAFGIPLYQGGIWQVALPW